MTEDTEIAPAGPTSTTSIETHSLEPIPAAERYGTAKSLFSFWFSGNLIAGPVVAGAGSALVGLPLLWTIVAMVIGQCLGGILMALHSAQGPKLGIPQMIQSRAQFGYRGAAITVIPALIMYIGYFGVGVVVAGGSLAELTHWNSTLCYVIVGILCGLLALYGYRILHVSMKILVVVSGVSFLILTIAFFVRHNVASSFGAGEFSWKRFMMVMGVSVGWQLTYMPYVADYSRYLPENTSIRSAFWYSYGGNVSASLWMFIFGAFGTTVASDAFSGGSMGVVADQAGFGRDFFLFVFVISMLPANALNGYGGFMSVSTIITTFSNKLRISPSIRTVLLVLITILGVCVAVFGAGNFLNNFLNLIYLVTTFLIPWSAINLTDFYLVRKEKYDIPMIFEENGIYRGWDARALTAYVLGILIGLPFTATALYTGPIAAAMGGVDLTWIVCAATAALLYYGFVRRWPVRNGVSAFTVPGRTPAESGT